MYPCIFIDFNYLLHLLSSGILINAHSLEAAAHIILFIIICIIEANNLKIY
jgi:hypothetical protein